MSELLHDQEIISLSDRDHILIRPNLYIGAVDQTTVNQLLLENNQFVRKEVSYVPGLLKIINEIIDNSVDEAIRTKYQFANKIRIDINETSVSVEDNGRGIPVKKIKGTDHYMPVVAFCNARSGSNFSNDNRVSIGMNGVGSTATTIFSKLFKMETADGENKLSLTCRDNMESDEFTIRKNSSKYTKVYFEPDLNRFSVDRIDETHVALIKQRLMFLSISHPEVTFYLNKEKISLGSPKDFLKLFSESYELLNTDNWFIGVYPNEEDDHSFFSYVNGLFIKNGGNHVNLISNEIVSRLRDKISRKFKSIKPGDIKNKLSFVIFFKNFPNMKFDSQTKENLTNSVGEIRDYLGLEVAEWDKFAQKIYKNNDIVEPIIDLFRLKEEYKKKQELKKISNGSKRITSDKYYAPVGDKKYLFITEGDSATGGLSKILGRKDKAYFSLKGKPLNVFDKKTLQIVANKEIQTIVDILGLDLTDKNTDMDFEKVIFLSDQDSDGFHIRALLLTFFHKFTPKLIKDGRIMYMNTPLVVGFKNREPKKWFFNTSEYQNFMKEETSKYNWFYYKGLGSWTKNDLVLILEKIGGFEKLLVQFEYTNQSSDMLEKWMANSRSDDRKEMLRGKEFNISTI